MRTLALRHPAMTGEDVKAVQRRLHGILVDGEYGPKTAAAVYDWKWRVGFSGDELNTGIGPAGQLILAGKAKRTAAMVAKAKERKGTPSPPLVLPPVIMSTRDRIVSAAQWVLANRQQWFYRQWRPMATSIRDDFAKTHTDCSSFATLCYKDAGAPDPNSLDYSGQGYTGTLQSHGEWTTEPQPGDIALYGGGSGIATHAAVYIGGGQVISFGHTPVTQYPLRYRSDLRGVKSYL